MSRIKDIMSGISPERWRKAILRRKIGEVLEGHKIGWLSNEEAKDRMEELIEEYIEWVDKNKS
ncbi:hypothetical protein PQE66_gp097 [Bacillus phage PBC2]|uniref:Uncharacterized protein n=1 Tax=Bacillus phage PBC2 TaxID=1675029 RepID=A0A218KBZ4_9CAUD|nr:hypothetical protein PQE66_gp097 [Bacillus phage PBC2]AKQ08412.1 hypothetical protein PBC2_097 [Bacillus phage PBC2]